jgi:hypothetical protein
MDRKRLVTMDRFSFRKTIRTVLLGSNSVLWGVLWSNFFLNSSYLRSGYQLPDDRYTVLIVIHRAASAAMYATGNWSYYAAFFIDFPAYLMTRLAFRLAFGSVYDAQQYVGTTIAGYELICWMVVSFFQWYLIGRVISWLMSRRQQHVVAAAQQ